MTVVAGWAALAFIAALGVIAALPAIPWRHRQPDGEQQQRRQELAAAIAERGDQAQARWDQRQATWQRQAIAGRIQGDAVARAEQIIRDEADRLAREMPGLDMDGRWNG